MHVASVAKYTLLTVAVLAHASSFASQVAAGGVRISNLAVQVQDLDPLDAYAPTASFTSTNPTSGIARIGLTSGSYHLPADDTTQALGSGLFPSTATTMTASTGEATVTAGADGSFSLSTHVDPSLVVQNGRIVQAGAYNVAQSGTYNFTLGAKSSLLFTAEVSVDLLGSGTNTAAMLDPAIASALMAGGASAGFKNQFTAGFNTTLNGREFEQFFSGSNLTTVTAGSSFNQLQAYEGSRYGVSYLDLSGLQASASSPYDLTRTITLLVTNTTDEAVNGAFRYYVSANSTVSSIQAIPEPGTLALSGMGLLFLAAAVRRSKKSIA